MIVRNSWSMVACVVCLAGALGCSSKSDPTASSVPKITSFSPASGYTGSTVTLEGSGFDGTTAVSVGGASATFTRHSDSNLTLVVPSTATTGVIAVVNRLGSGGSTGSFYVSPSVTSISPIKGSAGTTVTITGTGLGKTKNVLFGNQAASSLIISSSTQLIVTVPWGATSGVVTVVSSNESTAHSGTAFTYSDGGITKPVLSSIYPFKGEVGSSVYLAGSGFTAVSSVKVGGVACAFTLVDDSNLTATVPNAAITGTFEVISNLGNATSASTYQIVPQITSFTPAKGPAGTLVELVGSGFTGTTSIQFGNSTVSNFIVVDANHAQANVAAGSQSGLISLVASGLTGTSPTSFTFLADATARPVITSLSSVEGLTGSSLTLTGTSFTGVTALTVGGAEVSTFTVDSDSQITLTVPQAAATGFISATNTFGTNSSDTSFRVTPTITAISPLTGPAGTLVTLTGTGFIGTTSVTFGGSSNAGFVVVSANQVLATVPADAATGAVALVSSGVACTSDSSNNFTVTE